MAKVVRGVDSYKKEFLSIFNSLCGRHGRWEVWSDFIQLTAIDISNVTDKANAPKRAADARNIAKKYSEDEIKRMAEMLMQMVYAIDEKPDQDFLGELYMTCELGNDHAGQFFTPYSVCQAMSEISFDPARFEDKGFVWTPCWSARLRRRRNTTKRLPCRIWMWKWQSCGLICG